MQTNILQLKGLKGKAMAVETSLMKKYALAHAPTELEISRWVEETEKLLNLGVHQETAGARAAEIVFPDAGRREYDPQAEDIVDLLGEAKAEKAGAL